MKLIFKIYKKVRELKSEEKELKENIILCHHSQMVNICLFYLRNSILLNKKIYESYNWLINNYKYYDKVPIDLINNLIFFYFGQNKQGSSEIESIAGNKWRGFSPSAEMIGEFYGIILLFTIYFVVFKISRISAIASLLTVFISNLILFMSFNVFQDRFIVFLLFFRGFNRAFFFTVSCLYGIV